MTYQLLYLHASLETDPLCVHHQMDLPCAVLKSSPANETNLRQTGDTRCCTVYMLQTDFLSSYFFFFSCPWIRIPDLDSDPLRRLNPDPTRIRIPNTDCNDIRGSCLEGAI